MHLDPEKPTIILATSNGIGMGHLARACAISMYAREWSNVIIVSMASGVAMIPSALGLLVEYIPGRDRNLMPRKKWDKYLADRLVALIDETKAVLLSFDGVIPYPGLIAAKNARPATKLVWIRRGLWQEKPHRHLLSIHSKLMDFIIEPGDYAREYDEGPTAHRNDAKILPPISLYQQSQAIPKLEAQEILGIDPTRPAILIQLGVGDADMNEKMQVTLKVLQGWQDLQIIMTKEPIDSQGNNLAPDGLDIRIVKYFPLANLLLAFDAAISAAGYNGVHELLPAMVPTLFIPNIRGTDDQSARAKWTSDVGLALYADQSNLEDIKKKIKILFDPEVRLSLKSNCSKLAIPTGNIEASQLLKSLIQTEKNNRLFSFRYMKYSLQTKLSKRTRSIMLLVLLKINQAYNVLIKSKQIQEQKEPITIKFSTTLDKIELSKEISCFQGFEHLLSESSLSYRELRREIAESAYDQRHYFHFHNKIIKNHHKTTAEKRRI